MITIIFSLIIYYLDSTTNLNYKLWDVSTCTPSDFTVELKITEGMYSRFKR